MSDTTRFPPYAKLMLFYFLFGAPLGGFIWMLLTLPMPPFSLPDSPIQLITLPGYLLLSALLISPFTWLLGVIPATLTGILVCLLRLRRGPAGTLACAALGFGVAATCSFLPFKEWHSSHTILDASALQRFGRGCRRRAGLLAARRRP